MISLSSKYKKSFNLINHNVLCLSYLKNNSLVSKSVCSSQFKNKIKSHQFNSFSQVNTKIRYQFSSKNVAKQALQQVLNHPYSRLCRWEKPIGAMLLYWPCIWGIQAGANGLLMAQGIFNVILGLFPGYFPLYLLFLMGAWTSRSAGCIINDYLDKEFDRNVQRCKTRPLASGQVTTKQAAKLLFLNLCGGLLVLSQMNVNALVATFMILPISALYPLAKRYVKHPQAVLASAFNSGVFICALTVNPNAAWEFIVPLYISGICWTMIYDTIYAFQDIDDDKKLGLKSTAIEWQHSIRTKTNQLLASSFLLTSSLALFNSNYLFSLPIFIGAHMFLKRELDKMDIKNKASCGQFFKKNNLFGLLIFLGLLVKRLVEESKMQDKSSKHQKNQ